MAIIRRALISVTDKTGIVDFARGLADHKIEIISTGGTARALQQAGLAVREVSDVTGFPEMLDGRLKTINPRIAGGVLAMRSKPDHMHSLAEHGIPEIDMVVVNLYEFEKVAAQPHVTLAELIENIDIGGPTLIRAAAKNYQDVAVVTSVEDYPAILQELSNTWGAGLLTGTLRIAVLRKVELDALRTSRHSCRRPRPRTARAAGSSVRSAVRKYRFDNRRPTPT